MILSDFAHITNSSCSVNVFHMVQTVCRYLFSSSRSKEANIGDHLRKGSIFEQRERKYANTWGGGGRARGQKSLQKHFYYCIPFVFITVYFHSAIIFMRF